MGRRELSFVAVLLLVCVTSISGDVVIVKPVNKTVSIDEREDVVFECKYPPSESVEWYRSGMRISNITFDADRFSIQTYNQTTGDGSAISRLTVNSISRTEGGSYKCSNADLEKALFEERQSDEVTVKVIKVGAAIHIKGPVNDTVTQGQDLILVCTGDITADLVWHFKGQLVTEDIHGHVTITAEENRETSRNRLALTHSKATVDHEGLYTCHDQVNRKQASILIIVAETGRVVIVQPVNKTITVFEGSDVEFECQHPPSESVEWFGSGMRISNTTFGPTRFSIETDGKATSILTVSNIGQTESGVYKCGNANLDKALFRDGQTDIVHVKVIKTNAVAVVVRIEGPANNIVSQGHDLLLLCTGDITSELIWYFKGDLLTQDIYGQVIITDEENREIGHRSSALTRSRATADHEGAYHCYDKVNRQRASVVIKVTATDGGNSVQYSSTLLAMTAFTAAIAWTISV